MNLLKLSIKLYKRTNDKAVYHSKGCATSPPLKPSLGYDINDRLDNYNSGDRRPDF